MSLCSLQFKGSMPIFFSGLGLHNLNDNALMEKLRGNNFSPSLLSQFSWGCGGMVDAADLKSVDRYRS